MVKDPATKIYGVLGFPAGHSLSPLMQNAAFRALNINAEYKIFEIGPLDVDTFLGELTQKNIFGLNVTVPYKEKVVPFINSLSDDARLIAAVNTIKVQDGKLEGFNTDGAGFLRHLTGDLGFNPEGKSIAIIGAGGASKAVSISLSKKFPKRISIYDVDGVKLLSLVKHLKANFNNIEFNPVSSIAKLGIDNSDLLINATPIGMKKNDECLVDEKYLRKGLFVYDLVYNVKETKLLELARNAGAMSANGLGMLLYQGMLSFEIWTGSPAPKEVMQKALSEDR